MTADQQLQDAARAMTAAADAGRPVLPVLEQRAPAVYRQVVRDGNTPGLLGFWGRSLNVDEFAGQTIVHPAILHAIGELAGVRIRGRVVHAGLQHTYGYLFSLIETPFGAKRDRWVSTAMERGFGIEASLLGEAPAQGTLLANLTGFLARIAFRDDLPLLRRAAKLRPAIAPELAAFDVTRLSVCRIVEEATLPARTVQLITDLVPYPQPPADPEAESTLLIYSVRLGVRGPTRLVTAFPMRPAAVQKLKDAVPEVGDVDLRPRYNAYVPGFTGRTHVGRRYFADLPV